MIDINKSSNNSKNNFCKSIDIKMLEVCDNDELKIGLNFIDNKMQFNFPINYYNNNELELLKSELEKSNPETLKNDMINLLNAIYKTNTAELYNNYNCIKNENPIYVYLWLIRDYLTNGYFIEREEIDKKQNQGKINWKKTIKNNETLISNNNIIFTKFITKHFINNEYNIITQIHKYCIFQAIDLLGFFYSINSKSVENPIIKITEREMIKILKAEYNVTFLDVKKELLSNMIKMLEQNVNNAFIKENFSISVNKFETVFEYVVNKNFGNVEDISQYYPKAIWKINGKDTSSSSLREDTIVDLQDKVIIIDSKYYKYAYYNECDVNKLPETSSIAKQVIYGEFVHKKTKKIVYNVFLIPFNSDNEEYIDYIGYARPNWKKNLNSYDYIYTFKIDLKKLINGKLKNKFLDIENLIIENEITNIP